MPFGLKNAPSKFQNMMNEIFNEYTRFSIVCSFFDCFKGLGLGNFESGPPF